MTEDVKVLNSKDGITDRISPTGVRYKAFREGEAPLWELYAIRTDEFGKEYPDKKRNQPIEGTYTSEARALEALRRWLCIVWAESDAEAAKLAARRGEVKVKAA